MISTKDRAAAEAAANKLPEPEIKEAPVSDAEKAAIATFDELMAAKAKEVEALTKAIESKTVRSGDLAVEIALILAESIRARSSGGRCFVVYVAAVCFSSSCRR